MSNIFSKQKQKIIKAFQKMSSKQKKMLKAVGASYFVMATALIVVFALFFGMVDTVLPVDSAGNGSFVTPSSGTAQNSDDSIGENNTSDEDDQSDSDGNSDNGGIFDDTSKNAESASNNNSSTRPVNSSPSNNSSSNKSAEGTVALGVNIKDYGAVGNGTTDDTNAFYAAMLESKKQRLPVYLPSGTYRLTESITLYSQTIIGYDVRNLSAEQGKLPTILFDHSDVGFKMTGASINGVNLAHKQITSKSTAVMLIGAGNRITNTTISKAYSGIVFGEAGDSNPGRANIENVIMNGIENLGLYVSGTLDVTYIGNVKISGTSSAFKTSGIAFKFAQNDDVRVIGCSANDAYIGYQIDDLLPKDQTYLMSTWGNFIDCSASNVEIGWNVTSKKPSFDQYPITINRMTINAKQNAVKVNASGAQLNFCNAKLYSSSGPAILLNGGDSVVFKDCDIQSGGSFDAVRMMQTRNVIITSSKIKAGGRGVVLDKFTPTAILITNNTITAGGTAIVDNLPAGAVKSIANNK